MRATEALHLSNPNTKLDKETFEQCTHLDYNKEKEVIKNARKANRKERTPFDAQ